ncbi:SpvB/TcaC N-terminal domain-containing protein [Glycomyces sp. NPDC047010]|uniref:SpvB/TcaC N-terminal domain-containing protein n=1 Tax=Glycomyces sp. NPDC047010 TaxID=3155023 RepID=UPI0033D62B1B
MDSYRGGAEHPMQRPGPPSPDDRGPAAPAPVGPGAPELPAVGNPPARLGETFRTDPVTGSATLTVPLPLSPGRGAPTLAAAYDSASGPGLFGYGWDLPLPRIARRTDRGLPRYLDTGDGVGESDVFLAADAEDLVPDAAPPVLRTVAGTEYRVQRYRPRLDDGTGRVERWTNTADRADVKWRTLSGDNATAWFGEGPESRVSDPADPARIFAWLVSFTHDDKGNAVAYEYAAEDGAGVDTGTAAEAARTDRTAARHLKRVRYGNTAPYRPVLAPGQPATPRPDSWIFTLVLDYGDHDPDLPLAAPDRPWAVRPDPYSDRRPAFEVRHYRRCLRALMFHDLPELGAGPTLVRSVAFGHETDPVGGDSRLTSVTTSGHLRDGDDYTTAGTPPLALHYAPAEIDPTVRDVHAEHLPAGLDLTDHTWVDLDGDGVAGVLTALSGAWYHLRNTSPLGDDVSFGPALPVPARPSDGPAAPATDLLVDVDGTGVPDLVRLGPAGTGRARRGEDGDWEAVAPFASQPGVDLQRADVRLADLTGDGLSDLVVADAAGTRWCEGLGADGFAAPRPLDGPDQPGLLESSASAAVQFADMTGDGLPDLVRIANGTVTYRPSLGHGRFGPETAMDDAPWFDSPDAFDPRRVLLADLDGNRRADLVYLAADGVRLYANRGGDSWGPARALTGLPANDNRRRVSVVDLRGTGTACLVWSTSLPSTAPLRYIDLLSAGRPHLLTGYDNGVGGEVRVEYRSSTSFALADEQAGRPWPARLPFPVACAHRVTRTDRVRETVFTAVTGYHDGYFDPAEREFRGFGMVETVDTEAFELLPEGANTADADLHQAPVLTRTWFHTGAAAATGDRLLHARRDQYWDNPDLAETPVPEPEIPTGLTDDEYRQACRAFKGTALRTEVFGLDDAPESVHPYAVNEAAYTVVLRQPQGNRHHAVFQLLPTEAVTRTYDRVPGDPRTARTVVLETDDLGLPVRTATLAHGRTAPDPSLPQPVREAQARTIGGYLETEYTPDLDGPDLHRLRQVCETRSYELAGLPAGHHPAADLDAFAAAADRVPYEAVDEDGTVPAPGGPVLRLTGRTQVLFRADDLTGPLPLGTHDTLGLTYRTRRLAFTDGLVAAHYDGTVDATELAGAGYEPLDGGWWATSGTAVYAPDAADHFYLASGAADPLGAVTEIEHDAHDLAITLVRDPIGHEARTEHDYRVLAPRAAVDPAGNRAEVRYDALGAPVASALVGRPGEPGMDTLDDPSATMDYDLFAWADRQEPVSVRRRHRERHGDPGSEWREFHAYFDGSGTPVLVKARAAAGKAKTWDPATGTVSEVDADPRWIGSGRAVFNNKGLAVKQYEPYFSATHEFESATALVQTGVTSVTTFDPIGRAVRVDHPDGTFARTDSGPWGSTAHGPGDTVLDSAWYAERGAPDPAGPEPADPDERAAWIAAQHAGTPGRTHTDALGRTLLTVSDNGGGDLRNLRGDGDATGGFTRQFDARDRLVTSGVADLLGRAVTGESAERGRRWHLSDVGGRLVRAWDEHGRSSRVEFDGAHRPVASFATEPGEGETAIGRVVYGDAHPQAAERNLTGRIHMVFDAAGVVVFERYDHKGAPLDVVRRLCADPATDPDWGALVGVEDPALVLAAAGPLLEPDETTTAATYDALGRPLSVTMADGTVLTPTYDPGGLIAELRARIGGTGPLRTYLAGQEHDALGRRLLAEYGNGLATAYAYDPLSRRLDGVRTAPVAGAAVQDLAYTYDASGNVVECADAAQQSLFFDGAFVPARMRFRHDAIGQLVEASGREHAANGQTGPADPVGAPLPHPNDTAAVRNYRQEYAYDDLGNLTSMQHFANGGGGWTRRYRYAHDADLADRRNRLASTSAPGDDPDGPYTHQYTHDAYGNLTSAPHLAVLDWDRRDQLRRVDLGGGGTAWYAYDGSGARLRKVIQRQGGLRTERRYFGTVEVYREWMNGVLRLERRTIHLADETGPFAVAEVIVHDPGGIGGASVGEVVDRYQCGDRIGSATVETDDAGAVVSYEEYHPFGSTAYRASRPGTDLSLKRFRFHGKERDEETGLDHSGARYYAPWLGRWTSADPAGTAAGPNLYRYCGNDPVGRVDPTGTQDHTPDGHPIVSFPSADTTVWNDPNSTPAQILREAQKDYPHLRETPRFEEGRWHFPDLIVDENGEVEVPGGGAGDAATDDPAPATDAGAGADAGAGSDEGTGGGDGGTTTGDGGDGSGDAGTGAGDAGTGADANDSPGDTEGVPGTIGTSTSLVPSAAERFIWHFRFPREGVEGSRRGQILEWLCGVPWRDNTAGHDVVTATEVRQIKSTGQLSDVGDIARAATRDAAGSIAGDPALAGRNPRAVIITETDVPASITNDITTATNPGRGRRIPPGAQTPEHIRGFPGRAGTAARVLTGVGTALSAAALAYDIYQGDYAMAVGDALGTVGGGLELYALAVPGATVAGVSAMTAGLVIGGLGIAATSAVSGYRAYQRGDVPGVVAGAVGVGAGLAIAAGAIGIAAGIAGAPVLLAVGIVAAIGVGIFHLGRAFDWW